MANGAVFASLKFAVQILRLKERIRELTRRIRGIRIERMVEKLSRYMMGWRGYFGFYETPCGLKLTFQNETK
jgi:RNA-directed DNA polymerase